MIGVLHASQVQEPATCGQGWLRLLVRRPLMENTAADAALQQLRPALTADGFDLRLGPARTDGTVEIILEAKPGACLECLVPEETMLAVIETALREEGEATERVILTKVGFDTAEHGSGEESR
jgi:Fe-S cluster biogenesis protein NfuA